MNHEPTLNFLQFLQKKFHNRRAKLSGNEIIAELNQLFIDYIAEREAKTPTTLPLFPQGVRAASQGSNE